MKRRLVMLVLAAIVTFPPAVALAEKITPPAGPAWRVWKEGDGGSIKLEQGATQELAKILITGTTELDAGADWAVAIDVLKSLGFTTGYSQVLHWPTGVLTCESVILCWNDDGWAVLVSTSERKMLLKALGRNGMKPPFDCSCPEAQLDLTSKVQLESAAADTVLFVISFILDQWKLPIAKKLLVSIAWSVWNEAIVFAERMIAGDWKGAADAARHLYHVAGDAIRDAILTNAGGTLAEDALNKILKSTIKLAFIEAKFVLAAAAFATLMGRAYFARDDVTNYHIGEGVGGV